MTGLLDAYAGIVGQDMINHLRQLARPLQGMKIVHVNSTRVGGGVAEILTKLVPLMQELNIDTSAWGATFERTSVATDAVVSFSE